MGRRWFGPPGAPGAPWRRPYYPSGPNRQLTGADGAFTIGRLPAGRITLIASPDEDLIPPELSPVTVKTGQKVQGYDILMAKGGTIRGKVVEAGTGKPVVGAIISNVAPQAGQEEYGPGYRYPHGPGYSAEDGETNRFGIYQLRLYPGTHSLYCTALEGAYELPAEPTRVVVEDDKPLPGINFVLKPAQPVRGVVCAPDGRPTAEVELIYTGEEDEQIPLEVGADGTFELPAGTWGMPQADERIPPALLATSKAKSWSAFVVGAPGQQSLKVPLQPGGFISFPVTDHNDKPLADFKVWVCGSYNEEGRYSITNTVSSAAGLVTLGPLPPGQMLQLVFDCPMVPLIVSQEWREPQPIMLRPGQHTQLTPMKVNPEGRSLKVFVGDEQQRPVKGAMVCAGGSEPLYTDDKGQVELKRLPIAGKVTVMALHPTESLFAAQTVDPDWGQWPGLLLKPYGTATGQIRTKDDKPLPRAIVYCSVAEDAELWNLGPLMGRFPGMYPGGEGETTTDDEGRFRVGSLIPGLRYEVMVAPPDGEMGPNVAGSFTATGGKDAQDVGIMTYEPAKAEE